ncbi:hypothetical protein OOU_Y34scaffold00487g33 [Pyricularia oryzae Y34]|uniref:Uncharacterized protein n=2 Tax=Pyricularia oryzae TaxID=318829 RepID=A0AA97P0E2_PYRO3|nr:hypothetical protein OOU_Y34scaffold00487g33 [Pyricularia oryzae Y34]
MATTVDWEKVKRNASAKWSTKEQRK